MRLDNYDAQSTKEAVRVPVAPARLHAVEQRLRLLLIEIPLVGWDGGVPGPATFDRVERSRVAPHGEVSVARSEPDEALAPDDRCQLVLVRSVDEIVKALGVKGQRRAKHEGADAVL